MDNTTAPTESSTERARRILERQAHEKADLPFDDPPEPCEVVNAGHLVNARRAIAKQQSAEQRGKPGRKPAPTTEELELELYQLNLQSVAIDSRRRQIRSTLKEKY